MSINVTSPITGGAQTGFTAPTYTVSADVAPDMFSKQVVVTALGGTQTGATPQAGADNPFTLTFSRPAKFNSGPKVNNINGLAIGKPSRNIWRLTARKGMRSVSTDSTRNALVARVEFSVPSGAESVDPAEIRALVSAFVGVLNQQSAGLAQAMIDGII